MHWKSCASRSALPSSSPGRKKNKIHAALGIKNPKSSKELGLEEIVLSCLIYDGFFISAFPVLDGVSTRVSLLTSRAPSSSPQGVGLVSRGEDIHQAAKEGNVGAVRHFLPESLETTDFMGRSLGTEVGSYEAYPRLP